MPLILGNQKLNRVKAQLRLFSGEVLIGNEVTDEGIKILNYLKGGVFKTNPVGLKFFYHKTLIF